MNSYYPKAVCSFLNCLNSVLCISTLRLRHGLLITALALPPMLAQSAPDLLVKDNPLADVSEAHQPSKDAEQPAATEKPLLLPSYSAIYSANKSGVSAELEQKLTAINGNQWRLHNKTSILFLSFEEEAIFTLEDQQVKPLIYRYDNSTSSSRSSQLIFDWKKNTVFDQLHSQKPLKLKQAAWDKLSVQAQIRLDLMLEGESYLEKQYQQIDRTKIKTYTVRKLGEETLNTPLGQFDAIKLEERRDGRDKYTLIWLARDWDYMILRLQRIEEGEVEYQIDLAAATINGKKLQGR